MEKNINKLVGKIYLALTFWFGINIFRSPSSWLWLNVTHSTVALIATSCMAMLFWVNIKQLFVQSQYWLKAAIVPVVLSAVLTTVANTYQYGFTVYGVASDVIVTLAITFLLTWRVSYIKELRKRVKEEIDI
jgi:hypothetical protein